MGVVTLPVPPNDVSKAPVRRVTHHGKVIVAAVVAVPRHHDLAVRLEGTLRSRHRRDPMGVVTLPVPPNDVSKAPLVV